MIAKLTKIIKICIDGINKYAKFEYAANLIQRICKHF